VWPGVSTSFLDRLDLPLMPAVVFLGSVTTELARGVPLLICEPLGLQIDWAAGKIVLSKIAIIEHSTSGERVKNKHSISLSDASRDERALSHPSSGRDRSTSSGVRSLLVSFADNGAKCPETALPRQASPRILPETSSGCESDVLAPIASLAGCVVACFAIHCTILTNLAEPLPPLDMLLLVINKPSQTFRQSRIVDAILGGIQGDTHTGRKFRFKKGNQFIEQDRCQLVVTQLANAIEVVVNGCVVQRSTGGTDVPTTTVDLGLPV